MFSFLEKSTFGSKRERIFLYPSYTPESIPKVTLFPDFFFSFDYFSATASICSKISPIFNSKGVGY